MNSEYLAGNLRIKPLARWLNVTDEIDAENPPFSLAKIDGVGVLQFSTAMYASGKPPEITIEDLRKLLADFALSRELGRGFDLEVREQPLRTCAQSYDYGTQFLRVWYCSNGRDVVLATYVCEKGVQQSELPDCEKIVENMEFKN